MSWLAMLEDKYEGKTISHACHQVRCTSRRSRASKCVDSESTSPVSTLGNVASSILGRSATSLRLSPHGDWGLSLFIASPHSVA
jgi:hypothetical protein